MSGSIFKLPICLLGYGLGAYLGFVYAMTDTTDANGNDTHPGRVPLGIMSATFNGMMFLATAYRVAQQLRGSGQAAPPVAGGGAYVILPDAAAGTGAGTGAGAGAGAGTGTGTGTGTAAGADTDPKGAV